MMFGKDKKQQVKMCKQCNTPMRLIEGTNVYVCDKCGNTLMGKPNMSMKNKKYVD